MIPSPVWSASPRLLIVLLIVVSALNPIAASGFAGAMQVGSGGVATVVIGALLSATHSVFPLIICMTVLALLGVVAATATKVART